MYILMFSIEFLSALVMCFLWAAFLDLYCEDGVCTVESVVWKEAAWEGVDG
jgi:hypothetical protein